MPLERDEELAALLAASPRVAVIGASNKPDRPSYAVFEKLIELGFDAIPVNPGLAGQAIHGRSVVADLSDIDPPVDIVDVFRDNEGAGEAVDAAIAHGAKAVWLQLGVINEAAVARAEAAGLLAVVDHCIKIEAQRLGIRHTAPGR